MGFTPPASDMRHRAIGPVDRLPPALQRACEPGDEFRPIPEPAPHDWLANHPELGQTFEQFVNAGCNKPDTTRSKIYLQPLEDFPAGEGPSLEQLRRFAQAFFAIEVTILSPGGLGQHPITSRRNPYTRQIQLLTTDILTLLTRRLPSDAFCLLGITMSDLYPEPAWNFVFGQASLLERVAVYSFARYDPRFYGEERGHAEHVMLRRSCRVLAHETAHMFGIQHCIFFHCLMNGSNHVTESDARPLHLCPADLRKLHHSVGFDVVDRYRRLRDFWREVGFDDEAQWLAGRLRHIEA
ncbi:MAG: hypothetical protein GTN62_05880 [Gemmatimonadales bacterium]|nr:hypothetical protein [Gemmatimonadales bacterium]NIN11027.1 hypothetical protein [Gemmatimonadales bacterium]NIN49624.1 hypothetical protein [Gemmatimonadales bacterium]NIP07088.1 hypothetical protein [Gemmatimonadales bacterium]NIQ99479.1 hypothetical protein [Gemmatimonadales bacterium]